MTPQPQSVYRQMILFLRLFRSIPTQRLTNLPGFYRTPKRGIRGLLLSACFLFSFCLLSPPPPPPCFLAVQSKKKVVFTASVVLFDSTNSSRNTEISELFLAPDTYCGGQRPFQFCISPSAQLEFRVVGFCGSREDFGRVPGVFCVWYGLRGGFSIPSLSCISLSSFHPPFAVV